MTLLFFMQKNRDDAVQLGHKTRIKKDLDIKKAVFHILHLCRPYFNISYPNDHNSITLDAIVFEKRALLFFLR